MGKVGIRGELHDLVDQLTEADAAEALAYLRELVRDGQPAFLTEQAPIDDEPETDKERAAVAVAKDQFARGQVISAEEAKRRLLA